MKVLVVSRHNHYTPWNYYHRAAGRLGMSAVAVGPGHALESLDDAVDRHPDAGLVLVMTSGYFPDLGPARARGMVCAYHVLNTEIQLANHLRYAPGADLVLCPQRSFLAPLRAANPRTVWLPYGADVSRFRPFPDVAPDVDVTFVGNVAAPVYARRRELLRLLGDRYRCRFVNGVYFEDAARVYASGRVVWNESLDAEVNMRTFEALACGGVLVTNRTHDTGLTELFPDGEALLTYGDTDELMRVIDHVLANPAEAGAIARRGRERILAAHTWEHRLETIVTLAGREVIAPAR